MKTHVDTRTLVCAMLCTLLLACAPAEASSDDICVYKDALTKLSSLMGKKHIKKAVIEKMLLDEGAYAVYAYDEMRGPNDPLPRTKKEILKHYNGNLSFLFETKEIFRYFKKFVSTVLKDCDSSRTIPDNAIIYIAEKSRYRVDAHITEDHEEFDYDLRIDVTENLFPDKNMSDDSEDIYALEVAFHYEFKYVDGELILRGISWSN